MSIFRRHISGVHLDHAKASRMVETADIALPEYVTIPLRQHIGAGCEATVKAGDTVYVGTVIGDSPAFVSAPIHSSVSGTVESITEILNVQNEKIKCVKIKTDGLQTLDPTLTPPVIESLQDLISAVRASGIVGLGGAGFPTHVKLAYKDIDKVKKLYINLAECEPYITADNREAIENTTDIIDGILLVLKYTGIPECVIVVENNKPVGIKALRSASENFDNIRVKVVGSRYPKGAEKVLVYEAGGPVIGRGKLPADCGVIVMNVTSMAAIARYAKNGIPLVSRRVTVDGDLVSNPSNLRVPIGTSAEHILNFLGVDTGKLKMLIAGGAMMGQCIIDVHSPVTKTTNALLCFNRVTAKEKTPCIRCGKCLSVCPMGLFPSEIERAYDARNLAYLKKTNVDLCMNCGCCSYQCPAKRDLSNKNQLAKAFIKASIPKKEGK